MKNLNSTPAAITPDNLILLEMAGEKAKEKLYARMMDVMIVSCFLAMLAIFN